MSATNMPRFTAGSSLYLSTRFYLMTPSVASVGNSGLTVTPQQGVTFVPPCLNATGGCYPAPDGRFLSICPCGSPGTCGPCFDLSIGGYDLGSKNICYCDTVSVTPRPCCPKKTPKCCGQCQPLSDGTGKFCDGECVGALQHCP
jgi:hypothetical protein